MLEDNKLQYDVNICTTSTLSSDSSADEVQRKVVFTKTEHPITNRVTTICENMRKKIMSLPAQYEAQIGEQKKMFAEDLRRPCVKMHAENEEKKATKANGVVENEKMVEVHYF